MLDAFTDVLLKRASDREAEDALTREMMKLPLSDIQKIAAAGSVKVAFAEPCTTKSASDDDWLKKYEGTPLYAQAIALEEELLNIEGERIKRRLDRPVDDDLWTKEDMVRLKKRQLDLELSKDRGASRGEDEEDDDGGEDTEDEAKEAPKAPEVAEKAAGVARRPLMPSKIASYMPSIEAADMAGRALAHARHSEKCAAVKEALSAAEIGRGLKGAAGGALREGAIGAGTGAAGGALGGALFGGVGAAPGAAIGAGGGLVGGLLSGGVSGWKKGMNGG
jgi:hypothetical protein